MEFASVFPTHLLPRCRQDLSDSMGCMTMRRAAYAKSDIN